MRRNIIMIVMAVLLCCSIAINIYFAYKHDINKSQKISNIESSQTLICENKAKSAEYSPIENIQKNDILQGNPIDTFFDSHELYDSNTSSMSKSAFLYRRLWKAELDNAYEILINAVHKDVKGSFKQSKNLIGEYAEVEAEITCAVNGSNAFGDESGSMPEKVHYGYIHGLLWNSEMGDVFKNRTRELFEYCNSIGIEVNFVFSEKSLDKDNLSLFKMKGK